MNDRTGAPGSPTLSARDSGLIEALGGYLAHSRSEADVRPVIRAWCHDVARSESRPEQALILFKAILAELPGARHTESRDDRLGGQDRVIAMCIEEYFAK